MESKQAEDRILALLALVRTPGWAAFVGMVQGVVQQAKNAIPRAEGAHQMGFHAGVALTAEQLVEWPTREVSLLQEMLKSGSSDLTSESIVVS